MTKKFFEKTVKEANIVSEAHKYAMLRGWWTIKVESPTTNGVPDRLYLRRGVIIWIEWKRPGGVLSAIQIDTIQKMRKHGATVYILDNLDEAKVILK